MVAMKLLGKIPNEVTVACSGGPDSMAVLHFVRMVPARKVRVAFFDHGTPHSAKAKDFVVSYCADNDIHITCGEVQRAQRGDESPEEYWRNERYAFFHRYHMLQIITGHNLDDVCETWIFSALHGTPKLIPYFNKNVIRPFLLTPKQSMVDWCQKHDVPFLLDESNNDLKYMRNRIRHKIMPEALVVNPGLRKVIARKVSEAMG